ncbi:MAG: PilZ domain-containing protein [Deltaproteobacteria bacterium]|nr:PilZ domain-containing protein [Deltaproteobacteria bacterium]MDQ3298888.1 hypothetical protein [Myxococcota bacterium]
MHDFRREGPRIDVEALCWELVDGHETSGLAVDLSSTGLRIERPYAGGPTRREVPLQIEVPGIDEVMWARGDACFDVLVQAAPNERGGPLNLIRRTGYRIVLAATRDLRLLKEFVVETHRTRRVDDPLDQLALASCYLRA